MAEGFMARLGGWCFRFRWWVVVAWLVAAVGGMMTAQPVLDALSEGNSVRKKVESIEAYDLLSTGNDSSGQVVGLVDDVDPAAPEVRSALDAAATRIRAIEHIKLVEAKAVSTDGRALLVVATIAKVDRPVRNEMVGAVERELDRLDAELPAAADVRVGGSATVSRDAGRTMDTDRNRAELLSLPLTLVVLVIVFGGLIAAGLPVLAAMVSVAAVFPVLYVFTRVTDVDSNALTVASLLGLGLSVDYGLLLVARYREELAGGFAPEVAIGRAWATAGRTILFSALTVAAALAGLLAFSVRQLTALGAAGVSIALVAMLVSLTFTAALIGLARRRLKPPRTRRPGGTGFFAALAAVVQRRAALVAVLTAVLLLAAGLPLMSATVKLPGRDGLPDTIESVRVADELDARFGRAFAPTVTVVARADPAVLDTYAARWSNDPAVGKVQPAKEAGSGLATVELSLRGDAQDDAAKDLVRRVRADRPPGVASWVTGDAAVLVDLVDVIIADLPLALAITLTAMLLLLFAMTGSLVVPVKAILANVVSLGATLGVMVAVFEHGWLSGVLHTLTVGGLDPFVLVILFAFAFALSMDYEVFLLGRVKEYVDTGDDTDTAVRRGLQHTGRVITSAALLMVIVFGCFAAAQTGSIEQIGLGLTTAVLIDATIVRCLLVPATMTLLGRRNWWAPAPLRRLHTRIGLRERVLPAAEEPVPAPVREPAHDAEGDRRAAARS